jgi:hypothetical protein
MHVDGIGMHIKALKRPGRQRLADKPLVSRPMTAIIDARRHQNNNLRGRPMKINSNRHIRAALALSLIGTAAIADHPGFTLDGDLAGPIITQAAHTLPAGSWIAGLRVEYVDLSRIADATLVRLSEAHEHAHSVDTLWSANLSLAHGWNDDLTLGLALPYILRRNIREAAHVHGGADAVESHGDSAGVGDVRLFSQYRFHRDPARDIHSAAIAGIKAPTGETHEETRDGTRFATDLQPGSGSWDPFLGVAHSRAWAGVSVHANLLYSMSTEGAQNTELGDGFFYNLAFAYPLRRASTQSKHAHDQTTHGHSGSHHDGPAHSARHVMVELNGEWRGKDETDGHKEDNTGGRLLYLAPGVRLNIGSRWSAALSAGFPVLTDLNGTQSEPDVRITGVLTAGW